MALSFTSNLTLENDRVKLEPLKEKHIKFLSSIVVSNIDIFKYFNANLSSHELLVDYVEKHIKLRKKELKYTFAIYDKEKNRYAGSTSFLNISEVNERLEIGSTWVGKEFQKTGLNRNCKFLLLEYAFEVLKFERVELKTDGRNKQSQKAIEGIGAKYEGCLRNHTVMPDGYRRDSLYYSILKSEWNEVKNAILN